MFGKLGNQFALHGHLVHANQSMVHCMKTLYCFGPKAFNTRSAMRNANFEELNHKNGVVSAWVHGAPRGVPRWHINQSG